MILQFASSGEYSHLPNKGSLASVKRIAYLKRRGREVKSYTSAFAKAYNARLGNTVNEQLIKSSNLVADFWYTAWVDAGKPNLSSLATPMSNEENKAYKKEVKAYKKNELLKNKLLIARRDQREGE